VGRPVRSVAAIVAALALLAVAGVVLARSGAHDGADPHPIAQARHHRPQAARPGKTTRTRVVDWRDRGQPCPPAQSLVSATTWTHHRLAPGVGLMEGTAHDRTVSGAAGEVGIHVLRVRTSDPAVRLAPLVTHWADRRPLSALAAGHPHLVAATNTGLYDFDPGAPLGPVFDGGLTGGVHARPQQVLGVTRAGRLEPGHAWLEGRVRAGGRTLTLRGRNAIGTRRGLALFDSRWGPTPVAHAPVLGAPRRSVVIRHGRVAGPVAEVGVVPPAARLLVASSPAAERFLAALHDGMRVHIHAVLRTEGARPMAAGYAVGKKLLVGHGDRGPYLGCLERDSQAARTAVGIADHGRQLILAVVADHPGTNLHGLDQKEMARLMADLGAGRAWEWDGSGSSELIARLPHSAALSIRNYPADGAERPMPVGLGVFRTSRHR
jgi:hypothetical protein